MNGGLRWARYLWFSAMRFGCYLWDWVLAVSYQMLTGIINTDGLLYKKNGSRSLSPGRLQLLVLTVGSAFYYLMLVLGTPESKKLPELPDEFLMILGGSNLFYIGGKLYSLFEDKLDSLLLRFKMSDNNQHTK